MPRRRGTGSGERRGSAGMRADAPTHAPQSPQTPHNSAVSAPLGSGLLDIAPAAPDMTPPGQRRASLTDTFEKVALFGVENTPPEALRADLSHSFDVSGVVDAINDQKRRRKRFLSDLYRTETYKKAMRAKAVIKAGLERDNPRRTTPPTDSILSCGNHTYHETNMLFLNERGRVYHDHAVCKSWACPICGPKRAYLRALEIEQAILAAHRMGHKMVFLTFTMAHRKRDACIDTRKGIQDCYSQMMNRRALRKVLDRFGYVHQCRSWDFTWGSNGWHPHIHAIWFFNSDETAMDISVALNRVIADLWSDLVQKRTNRRASKKHGYDCEPVDMGEPYAGACEGDDADDRAARLARYEAKSMSNYAASADKNAGQMTPYDLLVRQDDEHYAEYARAYYDFYKGQKGVKRIRFSQGFREYFGIQEAQFEPPRQIPIAQLQTYQVAFLANEAHEIEFERIIERQGVKCALDWLERESAKEYLGSLSPDDEADALAEAVWSRQTHHHKPIRACVNALDRCREGGATLADAVASIADSTERAWAPKEPDDEDRMRQRRHYLNKKRALMEHARMPKMADGRRMSGLGLALARAFPGQYPHRGHEDMNISTS